MGNAELYAKTLKKSASQKPVAGRSPNGQGDCTGKNGVVSDDKRSLKLKYNELLTRYKQAEDYLNNADMTPEQEDKAVAEFDKILREISEVFEQTGEPEARFLGLI